MEVHEVFRTSIQSDFNQTPIMALEADFVEEDFHKWIFHNWSLSMWYAALYLFVVFAGRQYMEKRPPFEIRWALATWSSVLAVFSIVGAFRTVPETVYVLSKYGWEYSICVSSYTKGPTGFWTCLFTVSKLYELGDTIFIVLRKQNLIFLHWYHHVTVLVYTWYSYTEHLGPGRWFQVMNFVVHSAMYTYYALRAMRFKLPKQFAITITTMQIAQMLIGLIVNCSAYFVKSQGRFCQTTYENLTLSTVMYASYFALFIYFFLQNYMWKSSSKPAEYTSAKKVH